MKVLPSVGGGIKKPSQRSREVRIVILTFGSEKFGVNMLCIHGSIIELILNPIAGGFIGVIGYVYLREKKKTEEQE